MAAPLDQLSCRLFDLESAFAGVQPSQSLVSSSTSSSSDLSDGCPSLITSNSLSSEGFTESETDAVTPPQSPFVGSAYDVARTDSLDAVSVLEADAATPRPIRAERRSYFPQVGKADDEGYEIERGASDGWNTGAKKRHKTLRNRGMNVLARASRTSPINGDPASNGLALRTANKREEPDSSTSSALSRQNADVNGSLTRTCHPTRVDLPVPETSLRRSKAKNKYIGLGLGLPATWSGQCTPRVGIGSLKTALPTPRKSSNSPPRTLANQAHSESTKCLKKVALQPIDDVLAFVESPSPIEALPSPVLSGKKTGPHKLESEVARNRRTGTDSRLPWSIGSGARIGLGLCAEAVFNNSGSTIHKLECSSCLVPDDASAMRH